MPLRAIIEGKEVISTFLSDEEWDDLKTKIKDESLDVEIAQTGKKGYLRRSKLGLQHFAHKKGEKPEDWKPESPQHLYVKSQILLGCKDAGWNGISEFAENDWIADVLAVKGKSRIAFEVQWSSQTAETTKERQDRYEKDHVRGCWFFRKPPKELSDSDGKTKPNKDIPLFLLIEKEDKTIDVEFNKRKYSVREFVELLLNGNLKYCSIMRSSRNQTVTAYVYGKTCDSCHKGQYIYYIDNCGLNSVCGSSMSCDDNRELYDKITFNPKVIQGVKDFIVTNNKLLSLADIKLVKSKWEKQKFLCFVCHECGWTFFMDHQYSMDFAEVAYSPSTDHVFVKLDDVNISSGRSHWCLKRNKDFCE